jgi:FkbM family methyltransferase
MDELTLERYLQERLPIQTELGILFSDDARVTIFDVGACEGEDSIRYQRRFPCAEVYAFEPLPRNVASARRNFAAQGMTSITLEQVAVGDAEGEAAFHVSSGQPPNSAGGSWDYGNKSSSLLPPGVPLERYEWLKFEETITVPVTTLATYAVSRGIREVDLLHLDVQGAELMVLAGAGTLLDSIKAVWMEVEAVPLYRGQPLRGDVDRFMTGHGFVKVKDTVDDVAGDHLYIHPAFFGRWQRTRLGMHHLVRTRTPWLLPLGRRLRLRKP